MSIYVTIPCHRAYRELLYDCLDSLHRDNISPHNIFVIANGEDPIKLGEIGGMARLIPYEGDWNMSKWWNLGMDAAACAAHGREHEVLVLNADATIEPGFTPALQHALRQYDLAITAPDLHGVNTDFLRVNRALTPLRKAESMPGCAFMLRGEADLRCDTRFPGWFNDDDIEWQGRSRGGVGMVSDAIVHHTDHGCGDQFRDEGLAMFREKWGQDPWC